MRWTELTNLWQALAQWLEACVERLRLPRARTILAVAMGCAALTLNTLTASAGSFAVTTTTVPVVPPSSEVACQMTLCIGPVTHKPRWIEDSSVFVIDFTFDTNMDAAVVLTVQITGEPYVYPAADLVPTRHHTLEVRDLPPGGQYDYTVLASAANRQEARATGTFRHRFQTY